MVLPVHRALWRCGDGEGEHRCMGERAAAPLSDARGFRWLPLARVGDMAKRTSTVLIDDLTGAALGNDAVTVSFAFGGAAYEIDLAPSAAAELREALQPFIGAARKTGRAGRGSASSTVPAGEQSAARAWLLEQGLDVPSRGRLSAEPLERYRAR